MGRASRRKQLRRCGSWESGRLGAMLRGKPGLTNHDAPKITAAIKDIVEPLFEGIDDVDDRRYLIGMAVIAWNLSVQDGVSVEDLLDGIKMGGDRGTQTEFKEVIRALMAAKQLLHPHDKRLIVDYEIEERPNGELMIFAAAMGEPPEAMPVTDRAPELVQML